MNKRTFGACTWSGARGPQVRRSGCRCPSEYREPGRPHFRSPGRLRPPGRCRHRFHRQGNCPQAPEGGFRERSLDHHGQNGLHGRRDGPGENPVRPNEVSPRPGCQPRDLQGPWTGCREHIPPFHRRHFRPLGQCRPEGHRGSEKTVSATCRMCLAWN